MDTFRKLRRRLFIFQIFLLLAGSCAVAYSALQAYEADLEPEITRKGDLVARSVAGQFERALDAGIVFPRLQGAGSLFASIRQANHEIVFIAALADSGGQAFYDGVAKQSEVLPALQRALQQMRASESAGWQPDAVRRPPLRWDGFLMVPRPIITAGERVGWVLVGIDANYVQQRLSDVFYDILVVLLVSLLLTFELLVLITANVAAPVKALQSVFASASGDGDEADRSAVPTSGEIGRIETAMRTAVGVLRRRYRALLKRAGSDAGDRDGDWGGDRGGDRTLREAAAAFDAIKARVLTARDGGAVQATLVRVRMPLFVFFIAEELSRPFFPIYARSLEPPLPGLSPELVVSLPMMLFMLVVALSQPLGGPWAQRLGAARLMVGGAIIGAAGLALTASAESLLALLAWRLITAVGYGLVFVAGQSFVVGNTDAGNRAWGLAMFVGAVLAASICGPAVGGILADRVGYRATFLAGAGLALLAALIAWRLLAAAEAPRPRDSRPLRLRDVGVVLRNPRFLALITMGAMPAKIILTGFLYYLAPLYLADLGNSQSASGRIMMLYGLMMVLVTPLAARTVDHVGRPLLFVVLGGLLSGAGLLGVLFTPGTAMVLVGIVILGIAQAISITPQLSLVPVACPEECRVMGQVTVIGFFRLFERLGSALGPVLAAALLHAFGYVQSMVVIGCGIAACCLLLAASWRLCAVAARRQAMLREHPSHGVVPDPATV